MMPECEDERILRAGAQTLEVALNDAQISQLLHYLKLLLHWNKAYNLIAEAPRPVLISRHLLDSLAVLPWLSGNSAVDLGTGAGLPGIPLAIAQPQRQWWLVDSANKRIRFLRQVVRELSLTQVAPQVSRIERWQPQQPSVLSPPAAGPWPQAIIVRAVAAPLQMLHWVRHLLQPGTALYLMMGRASLEQLRPLPAEYQLRTLQPLQIPFLEGERHLAIIDPVALAPGLASNH